LGVGFPSLITLFFGWVRIFPTYNLCYNKYIFCNNEPFLCLSSKISNLHLIFEADATPFGLYFVVIVRNVCSWSYSSTIVVFEASCNIQVLYFTVFHSRPYFVVLKQVVELECYFRKLFLQNDHILMFWKQSTQFEGNIQRVGPYRACFIVFKIPKKI
jgi:hypothetical protein